MKKKPSKRNFVAKHAKSTTSGAGIHKDKKKAMKRGERKYKNSLTYMEHLENLLWKKLNE